LVEVKNLLEKAEKPERFWKDGIFKLPERWRKIVEQNSICLYYNLINAY